MSQLQGAVADLAEEQGFSGAVRIDRRGSSEVSVASGLADRAYAIPNTPSTQFAIASGCKGFTALAAISLVAEGRLGMDTTARSLLGADLPEIDDRVTVEHLLAHRSGIGDYFDEDDEGDITDYILTVPVHRLATTQDYLPALVGHPQKFPPGERFAYCNGGYVVLALLLERATGASFHDLVTERVCVPAGLSHTAYLRSDELSGSAARGYLGDDGLRTNVLHLPVRGSGDGGLYSTVEDLYRFWRALFDGTIVDRTWVDAMARPRSQSPEDPRRYGLGFWLDESGSTVLLEGYDAGVSFRSAHDPGTDLTWTVVSNTSDGAWPMARAIASLLG